MTNINAITFKQLRAILAIKEHGSITLAANALNLTIPAVSIQLKMLEENIGAELVYRAKEGKSGNDKTGLTLQGEQVLAAGLQIQATLEYCDKSINAINAGKSGFLSLGVVSTGKYFAPKIIALAKKALPDITIELSIRNRQGIIQGLQDQSLDLVIMGRPPRFPKVNSYPLALHPHIMIAPPDHPLVNKKNITPELLLKETFIMREIGSGTRILAERFLDRVGDGNTYEKIEFNTNETIKQAVIAGLGLAIISAHTVSDALEANKIITIDMVGLPIMRKWFLVSLADAQENIIAQNVQKFLEESKESYLPNVFSPS